MKILLLGAGASFGASRHGSFRPPLVTGILPSAVALGMFDSHFAREKQLAIADQLEASGAWPDMVTQSREAADLHLFVLADFIREQFDAEPHEYETASIDFERLFALTEAELLGHHSLMRHRRVVPGRAFPPDVLDLQLKLVLCGTLIAATRDVRCDYHDVLARWLEPGDAVVSFNYDLLMDRSLSSTGSWFQDDGYGLTFTRHLRRVGDAEEWRDPRATKSSVQLLKPHGSLNWLYPRNSWDSVMNRSLQPNTDFRSAPASLYCLDDMNPRFEDDYPIYEWWERFDIDHDDVTFDLHSLIVPPSVSKPYRTFEPKIGPLWGAFADALLTRAEQLVLVGYSLRSDDVRTHWLLRKAARQSDTLKSVLVVDPSDEVLRRATALFHPLPVERPAKTISELATCVVSGSL